MRERHPASYRVGGLDPLEKCLHITEHLLDETGVTWVVLDQQDVERLLGVTSHGDPPEGCRAQEGA
ncbi:hypothetical protein [Halomarina rubra]|uniref:hypothetical protein n=1 Tax=Halomarina rubra TaxID=2071873 RepID=UPI002032BD8C|nr:hypothetical protein [Halomarina rubra]